MRFDTDYADSVYATLRHYALRATLLPHSHTIDIRHY